MNHDDNQEHQEQEHHHHEPPPEPSLSSELDRAERHVPGIKDRVREFVLRIQEEEKLHRRDLAVRGQWLAALLAFSSMGSVILLALLEEPLAASLMCFVAMIATGGFLVVLQAGNAPDSQDR